jgi:hypothetical protein
MTPVEKIEKAKQYIELGNELMKEAISELSADAIRRQGFKMHSLSAYNK